MAAMSRLLKYTIRTPYIVLCIMVIVTLYIKGFFLPLQPIIGGLLNRRRKVRRFSVSLPPSLVEEFDETWRNMRYANRSKAVHDAVRGFITEVQWMKREAGVVVGVVLVLYYLDRPGLVEEVAAVQHRFKGIIASIQKMYVEENKMFEIIGVRGGVGAIKRLTQGLMAKKGVKQVKASIIAP